MSSSWEAYGTRRTSNYAPHFLERGTGLKELQTSYEDKQEGYTVTFEFRRRFGIDPLIPYCQLAVVSPYNPNPTPSYFNETTSPPSGNLSNPSKESPNGASSSRFEITVPGRSRMNRGPGDYADQPFAFAFLPLFPDGRAALEDGVHALVPYRADRLGQVTPEMSPAIKKRTGPPLRRCRGSLLS